MFTVDDLQGDADRVKQASNHRPVIITDNGQPAYVLMTIAAYEGLLTRHSELPLVEFLESLALDGLDLTRDSNAATELLNPWSAQ